MKFYHSYFIVQRIRQNLLLFIVFMLFLCKTAHSQNRFAVLDSQLTVLSATVPNLNQKVEATVNGVSIQEFINGIAIANALDLTTDADLKINVVNSFSSASVKDILLYLCKQYNLDLTFIGNIINIEKYNAGNTSGDSKKTHESSVKYVADKNTISYDFKSDSLFTVAKELASATNRNFILSPALYKKTVSGYISNMSLTEAMEMLAYSNNYKVIQNGDNFLFSENDSKSLSDAGAKKITGKISSTVSNDNDRITIKTDSTGNIDIKANGIPLLDIIETTADKLGLSYFIASEITGSTTIDLQQITFTGMLNSIFKGTDYNYKYDDGFYIFGKSDMEGLRETRLVKLNYRSVDKVSDYIPAELKKDIEIKEFPELNSLILCGSQRTIEEVDSFLFAIDKVVPVIMIEVLIVESKRSHSVSTGLSAGINNNPKTTITTQGTIYPTADLTLDANSINSIINSLNGFGWVNLGNVTTKFFASLQAMEEDGIIKVNSTPKLATLNGNEATLSIGNTEYYLEETNNLIATQSTQNITTHQYKAVNADLTLTIKPFVSGNDQITLNIEVTQSDFTARISPNAPPGSVTRSFSSLIRVKNSEMVLLGGLEKKSLSTTGSGVPFLARVPVIKWFFSSQKREKSKTKLNLFIRPTVIY